MSGGEPESGSGLEPSGSGVEPSLGTADAGAAIQFDRQGYFCVDADSRDGRPGFNRTIGLRDTWNNQ